MVLTDELEKIVIKYVVTVHRGVGQDMNFVRLSHNGVTLDVQVKYVFQGAQRLGKNGSFLISGVKDIQRPPPIYRDVSKTVQIGGK